MKILVVAKWMVRWNGASRVAYKLSQQFKKEYEVRIVAYKDHIDPEWEKEFEIYKLQHKGLFALNEIRKIIKEYKPDIIHSHDWLGLLALFTNIPQVATTHSNWPMNWFFSPTSFVGGIIQEISHEIKMHLVDKVISVSEYQQEKLTNRGIKSEVIYNGIGEEFFNPPENQIELKHPSILFVGGVDTRKAKYLVPFIKLLNKKSEKVHTYVIGTPTNKNIVEKLKNLDNTHYLGIVDGVKPYYHEADVLIFTSRMEACPLVPIEAQACGLPVVAFDVCSHAEIIQGDKSGYIVKPYDLGFFVKKVLELLSHEDLRKEMSENAIQKVKKDFLLNKKVEEYMKVFKNFKGR
jgi:glycosyltransferase involved in cell wall biosynthesis